MPRGTRKTYFKKKNTRNKKNIHKQRRRTRRVGSTKRKRGKLTRNTMSKKYKGGAGNNDARWTSPTLTPKIELETLRLIANEMDDSMTDEQVQNAQLNLAMRYLVGDDRKLRRAVIGTNPPLVPNDGTALDYLERAARGKDENHIAAAKFLIADIYKSGKTQNLGMAEQLLVDAIKLRHPNALGALHELYENNNEVSFHYKPLYPPPPKQGGGGIPC